MIGDCDKKYNNIDDIRSDMQSNMKCHYSLSLMNRSSGDQVVVLKKGQS